jgi:hypothetical protein
VNALFEAKEGQPIRESIIECIFFKNTFAFGITVDSLQRWISDKLKILTPFSPFSSE